MSFHPLFADGDAQPAQPDPAAGAPGGGAPPAAGGFNIMTFAPFILIGLFFLVVMLPAQRRQKKQAAERLAAMKPGAKVVTSSGIVGRIVSMKDGEDEIVIKSDDTKLRILKAAITTVVSDETPAATSEVKS